MAAYLEAIEAHNEAVDPAKADRAPVEVSDWLRSRMKKMRDAGS